jgi:hypothetical protein
MNKHYSGTDPFTDPFTFTDSFHALIKAKAKARFRTDNMKSLSRDQIKVLLREVYSELKWDDGTPMSDVAEVVIKWLETNAGQP